jgi:hypothetical protein
MCIIIDLFIFILSFIPKAGVSLSYSLKPTIEHKLDIANESVRVKVWVNRPRAHDQGPYNCGETNERVWWYKEGEPLVFLRNNAIVAFGLTV